MDGLVDTLPVFLALVKDVETKSSCGPDGAWNQQPLECTLPHFVMLPLRRAIARGRGDATRIVVL